MPVKPFLYTLRTKLVYSLPAFVLVSQKPIACEPSAGLYECEDEGVEGRVGALRGFLLLLGAYFVFRTPYTAFVGCEETCGNLFRIW
jgi:hypothetical protein